MWLQGQFTLSYRLLPRCKGANPTFLIVKSKDPGSGAARVLFAKLPA